MQTETNLPERRGFEFSNWQTNTFGILMVKAPIELVSPAISEILRGELRLDVLIRQYDTQLSSGQILYQYQGHNWTIILNFSICASSTVAKISEQLQSDCIYLETEDTSGCSSYTLLEKGKIIEELHWGVDYTEEVLGIETEELLDFVKMREAQGNPLAEGWDPRKWDIYCFEGYSSYQFRSNKYKATSNEVKNTESLLDKLFKFHDAWLPDWEYIPALEEFEGSKISAEDFVRVDIVHGGISVNEALAMLDDIL